MQHVPSDDVQNAEAGQDSDCPRVERWRWSPGVEPVGNCHFQIVFLYAFEAKLLVLIGPLPCTCTNRRFKISCCSSVFDWGDRYRRVHSRAIRQMSYFVVGEDNAEKPCTTARDGGRWRWLP
jgi:hypothetical protein